ncbi:MAG TPA: outer membrane beta-barrel domain-containing protein [Polyangiales bacterium]
MLDTSRGGAEALGSSGPRPAARVMARIGQAGRMFAACSWLLLACAIARAEDRGAPPPTAESPKGEFIDEAIRDELNARRKYRGVQERVFQKALRHELSAFGGGYMADLTSSSYLAGGAYTFHISEDLALEGYFGYTRQRAELVRIAERRFATDLIREDARVFVYGGHLLWNLAYGKLRWFHARVSRFDFYLALGGGITDNSAARTLTFSGGFGLKFYPTSWFAVRLDVRDQVLNQELLGESRIVNNLLTSLGVSVFLPFKP